MRVFVTGLGVVSPIGNSCDEFWSSAVEGKSGIRLLESIDTEDLPVKIGGEVLDLDVQKASRNSKVAARKMDRGTIFAVIATEEALTDAKLPLEDLGERYAVITGSGLAGLQTLQNQTEVMLRRGPRGVSPFTIPILMPNAASANISLAFGITGTACNVASACSSSGHAIIDAYETIRRGDADVVVTGGTESCITRLGIAAFANMKAMTKKGEDCPSKALMPFDKNRNGFIMSEGSAILILESEEHAKARGAKIYAEVAGYGTTMDNHHLVQPDPSGKGAARAIAQAMTMANWKPDEVAGELYVNAHGTSTQFNDAMESKALRDTFGDSADKLQVSSTKGTTGHLIGAACAIESIAALKAIQTGVLPPTINYETPDPDCDLDYIPNKSRQSPVRFALNNSFGFGGHNVCLAFRNDQA